MKKFYTLLVALVLVGAFSAQAQLKLGVKGGANFPSLNSTDGSFDYDSKTGFHGGAMVEIKLPIIGIQGDLLYSQSTFEIPNVDKLKMATFDIPIVAKLYILKIFTIQAGPQFSFLMSADSDLVGDVKDQISTSAFQVVAGLGVNLGPLDVHGRFIFPSKTEFTNSTTEFKNSNFQLSVGFWLKK